MEGQSPSGDSSQSPPPRKVEQGRITLTLPGSLLISLCAHRNVFQGARRTPLIFDARRRLHASEPWVGGPREVIVAWTVLLMDKILHYPLLGIYHNSHSLGSLGSFRILSISRNSF